MTITGKLQYREGPLEVANGKSSTEELWWVYSDDPLTDTRDDALSWLLSNSSLELYGLPRAVVTVGEHITSGGAGTDDLRIWPGTCSYVNASRKKSQPLQPDKDLDKDAPQATRMSVRSASSGSKRLTYSKAVVNEIGNPGFNFGTGALGRMLALKADDAEDSAAMFIGQGIDFPLGLVEIVVETVRLNESVTESGYLVNAADLASRYVINDKEYYGYPAGTLQLRSFAASQRGADEGATGLNTEPWDVSYTFAYSANTPKEDISLPLGLQGPFPEDKKGFQHFEILYTNEEIEEVTSGAKFVLPYGQRASLHDIYDEADFAAELLI